MNSTCPTTGVALPTVPIFAHPSDGWPADELDLISAKLESQR